ncbi:MAG TPA: hypothetical protein VMU53_14350 [Candidatus Sulfotelmatobacter sp.]|nr:hypothetical protein [Candidatus Sulfotelmatobacter sp.]
MRRLALTILSGFLFAGIGAAQSDKDLVASNRATESERSSVNGPLTDGATISANLTKTVDSNKLKKGDEVTARTIDSTKEDGRTVIPANTIIRGHVTQASAREKGDSFSSLGIVFDKAILKNGGDMPLNVTVQAIAPPATDVNGPPSPAMDTAPLGNDAPQGGADRQAQDSRPAAMPPAPPSVPDTIGSAETNQAIPGRSVGPVKGGLNHNGVLNPNSQGVYGLRGIGLATSTVDRQQASVITSPQKTVRLNSGTQLLLVTQPVSTQTSRKY